MRRYLRSLENWQHRDAEIKQAIKREWQIRANIARTGYPDPQARYHQHDTRPVEEQHITSKNPDPLFIEWVYVIDPQARMLHVLAHRGLAKEGAKPLDSEWCRQDGNGRWDYGHCVYWHELVGKFHINGTEPDWQALEAKGR